MRVGYIMIRYIMVRLFWTLVNLLIIFTALYFIIGIVMNSMWYKFPIGDLFPRLVSGYFNYLRGIVTKWDLGVSSSNEPVWETLLTKMPYTLGLNLMAFAVYTPLGLLLGIIAAMNKNKFIDNFINGIIMLFSSMHSLILIFLLMVVFGYTLDWLPPLFPSSMAPQNVRRLAYVIPIIALALFPIAEIARVSRGELSEALNSKYVVLARVKGLKKKQILVKHGLRNSMIPIMPLIITTFVSVSMSSFFVEKVYAVPGVANWFLKSLVIPHMDTFVFYIDPYVVIAITMFYSVMSLIFALIIDVLYCIIDPRIRVGSRKHNYN